MAKQAGGTPITVMSYQFWMRRFNGDPAVVGQTLQLNGRPFTVIGVAPQEFHGTTVMTGDVWVPINMVGELSPRGSAPLLKGREFAWLVMGARLKPGVTVRQAKRSWRTSAARSSRSFRPRTAARALRVVASSPIPGQRRAGCGVSRGADGNRRTRARDRVRERRGCVAGPRHARDARRSPCVSRSARDEAG